MASILFKRLGDDPTFPRSVLRSRDVAGPVLGVVGLVLSISVKHAGPSGIGGGFLVAAAYSAVAFPTLRYMSRFGWWALGGGALAGALAGATYGLLFPLGDLGLLRVAGLGMVAGVVITAFQLVWIAQGPVLGRAHQAEHRDQGAA